MNGFQVPKNSQQPNNENFINNLKKMISDLVTENEAYKRTSRNLLNNTKTILESNEELKRGINFRRRKLKKLKEEQQIFPQDLQSAVDENEKVKLQLEKYQKHFSSNNSSDALQKIKKEKIELDKIILSVEEFQKKHLHYEIQVKELHRLKDINDNFFRLNTVLRNKVQIIIQTLENSNFNQSSELLTTIEKIKSELIHKETSNNKTVENSDNTSDLNQKDLTDSDIFSQEGDKTFFINIDTNLCNAIPIFKNLEKILDRSRLSALSSFSTTSISKKNNSIHDISENFSSANETKKVPESQFNDTPSLDPNKNLPKFPFSNSTEKILTSNTNSNNDQIVDQNNSFFNNKSCAKKDSESPTNEITETCINDDKTETPVKILPLEIKGSKESQKNDCPTTSCMINQKEQKQKETIISGSQLQKGFLSIVNPLNAFQKEKLNESKPNLPKDQEIKQNINDVSSDNTTTDQKSEPIQKLFPNSLFQNSQNSVSVKCQTQESEMDTPQSLMIDDNNLPQKNKIDLAIDGYSYIKKTDESEVIPIVKKLIKTPEHMTVFSTEKKHLSIDEDKQENIQNENKVSKMERNYQNEDYDQKRNEEISGKDSKTHNLNNYHHQSFTTLSEIMKQNSFHLHSSYNNINELQNHKDDIVLTSSNNTLTENQLTKDEFQNDDKNSNGSINNGRKSHSLIEQNHKKLVKDEQEEYGKKRNQNTSFPIKYQNVDNNYNQTERTSILVTNDNIRDYDYNSISEDESIFFKCNKKRNHYQDMNSDGVLNASRYHKNQDNESKKLPILSTQLSKNIFSKSLKHHKTHLRQSQTNSKSKNFAEISREGNFQPKDIEQSHLQSSKRNIEEESEFDMKFNVRENNSESTLPHNNSKTNDRSSQKKSIIVKKTRKIAPSNSFQILPNEFLLSKEITPKSGFTMLPIKNSSSFRLNKIRANSSEMVFPPISHIPSQRNRISSSKNGSLNSYTKTLSSFSRQSFLPSKLSQTLPNSGFISNFTESLLSTDVYSTTDSGKRSNLSFTRSILQHAISTQLSTTSLAMEVTEARNRVSKIQDEIDEAENSNNQYKILINHLSRKQTHISLDHLVQNIFIPPPHFDKEAETQKNTKILVGVETDINDEMLIYQEQKIKENNAFLAKAFILEREKKVLEENLPQLEEYYDLSVKKGNRYQRIINDYQQRINFVRPDAQTSTEASIETRNRIQFEKTQRSKQKILNEIINQIQKEKDEKESIYRKINDQKNVHELLKKKIATKHQEPKPNIKKLCIDLEGAHKTEEFQKRTLTMLGLSLDYLGSRTKQIKDSISMINSLKYEVSDLLQKVKKAKADFLCGRNISSRRTYHLSNWKEMEDIESREKEIKLNIGSLRRKQSVFVQRIEKNIRILLQAGITPPYHPEFYPDGF